MKTKFSLYKTTLTAGFAVFSMFFGAGNLVFPLTLGRDAGDQTFWAILGMVITAVAGPIIGLISMVLYEGDYNAFFERIGRIPGFLATLTAVAIMGPFAVVPRCVVIAYSALNVYMPSISLMSFSIIAGFLIFVCCVDRKRILDILGYVLSPLLLILLSLIISKALLVNEGMPIINTRPLPMFLQGLEVGYDTMDLLGSLFFSTALFVGLKQKFMNSEGQWNRPLLITVSAWAGLIGGILIGMVYVGLSYGAAFRASELIEVAPEDMLVTLASYTYGSLLRGAAGIAVALACLTTGVTLVAVFADFLSERISGNRLPYIPALLLSVFITSTLSTLGFEKIMGIIHPVIYALYPSTIILTFCNMGYKLWGFKYVKVPVYFTLAVTLIAMAYSTLP